MFDYITLDKYNPLLNKAYQLIDDAGKPLDAKWKPGLDKAQILKAYKDLLFERTADLMAVSYQRQGRMFTYPPNLGQEAIHIAAGMVTKEQDWLVPAFRELGAWLAKGVSLREIFLYFKGHEDGSRFQKQIGCYPYRYRSPLNWCTRQAWAMPLTIIKKRMPPYLPMWATVEHPKATFMKL